MFALAVVIDSLLTARDAFDTMDGCPVANLLLALATLVLVHPSVSESYTWLSVALSLFIPYAYETYTWLSVSWP